MIRHLLVAFNGTDDSREALSAGISLSKQLNAHLSVLHVYENENEGGQALTASSAQPFFANRLSGDGLTNYPMPPVSDPRNETRIDEAAGEQYADRETNHAAAEAESILRDNKIHGEVKVMGGNPSDSILSYAEEVGADMIIVGHRGVSGFKKLVSSSVSDKVTKESVIPVLIAK
ncbi:universal stress protein [Metabacillus mangrovi]|nr:universal stress protein [Metabacillus mangrovi]